MSTEDNVKYAVAVIVLLVLSFFGGLGIFDGLVLPDDHIKDFSIPVTYMPQGDIVRQAEFVPIDYEEVTKERYASMYEAGETDHMLVVDTYPEYLQTTFFALDPKESGKWYKTTEQYELPIEGRFWFTGTYYPRGEISVDEEHIRFVGAYSSSTSEKGVDAILGQMIAVMVALAIAISGIVTIHNVAQSQ